MSVYGYKRGSIFWALTLIAVGALFLYRNFNPAVHPWEIIAKYWPILIIFWGLSKLLDYISSRAHPETVPPPLFSGSEVVLLILILVLGTLVSHIVLRPWQQWPAALGIDLDNEDFARAFYNSYTYTQTLSKPATKQSNLLLVNRRGDVEIHGSDQLKIEAVVKETIWAPNEEAAKKLSEQLKVELVEQAGRPILQSNVDSLSGGGHNVRLDVTLRVPRETNTEITTERGDLLLEGLKGEETLTTRRGDAHISTVEGLVRIRKEGGLTEVRDVKGNVEVEGRGQDLDISNVNGLVAVNGEFSGNVQFRNVSQTLRFNSSRTDLTAQRLTGRLTMEVGSLDATGLDGPFEISTRQKDITLTDFKHSVKIVNSNGDIRLSTSTAPTHPIEVDLKKGEIALSLPASSNFQIDASSMHGDVDCDFSGPNLKVVKEGPSPSITGIFGKGGPLIKLSTAYGTIRLDREGLRSPGPPDVRPPAHPVPPTPPAPPPAKATKQVMWRERGDVHAAECDVLYKRPACHGSFGGLLREVRSAVRSCLLEITSQLTNFDPLRTFGSMCPR
ncbi:MAG TPA: DUF4097 family beta strand repeat-containing protein [Terriglobia bacterium]|nr:DUF4097 family beta strand repeat-containing protein [Terriglobia bacterium]